MKKFFLAFALTVLLPQLSAWAAHDPDCVEEMKKSSLSPSLCKGGVTLECMDKLKTKSSDRATRAKMCQFVNLECLDYLRDRGVDYGEGVKLCKHFEDMDCLRNKTGARSLREGIAFCNNPDEE